MVEPPEGTSLQLVLSSDEETPVAYSNFAQVTFTPLDFTLHFGRYHVPALLEPPEGGLKAPVQPIVKVTIPLTLVRGLIRVLERQIDAWEGSFEQPLPDQPDAARPPAERQP